MASALRRAKPKGVTVLRPVHANVGIEMAYARSLVRMINEMHASTAYWVQAAYRQTPPKVALLAMDAFSFRALANAISNLTKRWIAKFDDAARKLATYYATAIGDRNKAALTRIVKNSGMAVPWKPGAAEKDIMGAAVEENVGLIKSIPRQYFDRVQQIVMQSVQTGRDVGGANADLQALMTDLGWARKKIVKKARLIAGDQNNKINAAMTRARQLDMDVDTAIWRHSHAGKKPRPTHLANDGEEYSVKEGWLDPAINKQIWPGTEINCRCVSRSIIKGLSYTKA
jgi:uncharacterized protein with gpF-like domain